MGKACISITLPRVSNRPGTSRYQTMSLSLLYRPIKLRLACEGYSWQQVENTLRSDTPRLLTLEIMWQIETPLRVGLFRPDFRTDSVSTDDYESICVTFFKI